VSERIVAESDLAPGDDKARAALERFRLARVQEAAGRDFREGWGALDAEFGPRGEIERPEVVRGWLEASRGRALPEGLWWEYHLIVARDAEGVLAGARDCHVTVDAARGECVVYLAHTLVLPPYRRAGLAALLRAAPVTAAQRALVRAATAGDVLLAAEMEPADPAAEDTIVRLVAYGRGGFAVVPPAVLPYCQADFRDPARIGEAPRPLPLLAVVRWLGHDGATALPARLCEAYVRHLYAVFATHCRPSDLGPPLGHALGALRAHGGGEVPLLALPRSRDDVDALAPLLRAEVLRHHSPALRS
jgi:GNAT superfamily N-acetyltransferase